MKFGWINIWGALVVIVMLIPNIIFAIRNPQMKNQCKNTVMNVLEQIDRYACMVLMIVPVWVGEFGFKSVFEMFLYFGGTGILLLAYWIVWCTYFKEKTKKKAMILAILPTAIFLLSGALLEHWLLVAAGMLFGVAHVYVTVQNSTYRI